MTGTPSLAERGPSSVILRPVQDTKTASEACLAATSIMPSSSGADIEVRSVCFTLILVGTPNPAELRYLARRCVQESSYGETMETLLAFIACRQVTTAPDVVIAGAWPASSMILTMRGS